MKIPNYIKSPYGLISDLEDLLIMSSFVVYGYLLGTPEHEWITQFLVIVYFAACFRFGTKMGRANNFSKINSNKCQK
jgi:hypothetical protein